MREEHKLHIPAALLIFGKKKVGRAALLWKISTRFVFNGKRRRILHGTKGEHKYRLATAHMALLCENGQGKKLACAAANRFSLPFVSLRYNTSAPHGGRNGNSDGRATEVRKPEEKVCFLMR